MVPRLRSRLETILNVPLRGESCLGSAGENGNASGRFSPAASLDDHFEQPVSIMRAMKRLARRPHSKAFLPAVKDMEMLCQKKRVSQGMLQVPGSGYRLP